MVTLLFIQSVTRVLKAKRRNSRQGSGQEQKEQLGNIRLKPLVTNFEPSIHARVLKAERGELIFQVIPKR